MAGQQEDIWLPVIGKALAVMALHKAELGASDIGEQAYFFESLGVPRDDVATMLKTTPKSLGTLIGRINKKGGGKSGKKGKKN